MFQVEAPVEEAKPEETEENKEEEKKDEESEEKEKEPTVSVPVISPVGKHDLFDILFLEIKLFFLLKKCWYIKI